MLDFDALVNAMGDLDEDTMMEILDGVMADGGGEAATALEACQKGMDIVGKLFEEEEYFVGDLIYAGELMTQAVGILKSALIDESAEGANKTKVVICTVKEDLHDIGKNIVKAMLEAAGFETVDLGIDTPPEDVVKAVQENDAKIVALSGVLTLALDSMKKTVDAIHDAGLTDVKVIIGGAPVNEDVRARVGADEWAFSPQKTVQVCQSWAG